MISTEMFNINVLPSQFQNFQQNLIISTSEIIYHCSSTTAYGIGQSHKLRKQNRKQLDNITEPSLLPLTPSYIYNKLNEYTDISH